MKEKVFKKHRIHHGKAIDFYVDEIILPNGKIAQREYTRHPGAVAIIPFLNDLSDIVLVKQYRYPVKKLTYELPAGKLAIGENPHDCAIRELEEETGYTAQNIQKIISFNPSAAFSTEILHIYIAKNLKKTKQMPDEDEFIEPKIINFTKALNMIKNGEIIDSKTIIGLLFFKCFL